VSSGRRCGSASGTSAPVRRSKTTKPRADLGDEVASACLGHALENDALAARENLGDVLKRDEHQPAGQQTGSHDECVGLIRPRPEHDRLDEAEPALGRVDAEPLAVAQPVGTIECFVCGRVHGALFYQGGFKRLCCDFKPVQNLC
jgi:hypothetical protein